MEVVDRVYGRQVIDEPVLNEVIASPAMQRLKGVNQAGASQYILHKPISRFEHSVGVMLLLRKLGAGLEEQIAGLLHDLAHTAFSHVADFAFPNQDHDFHERFHEHIFEKSSVPGILMKHGFDLCRMLDEKNFGLMERSLPDLCADRIDYLFRDMVGCIRGNRPRKLVDDHLASLIVHQGEIIVSGFRDAAQLTMDFIALNRWIWARPLEVASYQVLGMALKRAFDDGQIRTEDLFLEDHQVMMKLKGSSDGEVQRLLSLLVPGFAVKFDTAAPDMVCRTKVRYIDPKFLDGSGKIARVSEVHPGIKALIREHREFVAAGYPLKIIPSAPSSSS